MKAKKYTIEKRYFDFFAYLINFYVVSIFNSEETGFVESYIYNRDKGDINSEPLFYY